MSAADRTDTSKTRRARAGGSMSVGKAPRSPEDLVRMAREIQRKVHHQMQERPEAVLAAVAGASFVAGAIVGSRVGRIALAALVPLALQQALASRVAPRIMAYFSSVFDDSAGSNGTSASTHAS